MMNYSKNEVLLSVRNLDLTMANRSILKNVNFNIHNITRPGITQGQVVSLVGRSGIGKTQLFRILAGLNTPDKGEVLLSNNKPVSAGDMGVVFQNYYLFEWRTIEQSLFMAAKQNPLLVDNAANAVIEHARSFDLHLHLDKYPAQLSGGQRQRASIIQQVLKGSEFLLLDEPFSGLDVCVLENVVSLLLKVSVTDEVKTLIIVSHDIETSVAISDTVLILGKPETDVGATIVKEIDLIQRGLAWQPEIRNTPIFRETVQEIKTTL